MEKLNCFLGMVLPSVLMGLVIGTLISIIVSFAGLSIGIGNVLHYLEMSKELSAYSAGFCFIVLFSTLTGFVIGVFEFFK